MLALAAVATATPVEVATADGERALYELAADLAQRRIDVGLRQRAAAGQAVEDAAKLFGEAVEQRASPQCWPCSADKNTSTPEGASRCRAVAAGFGTRSARLVFRSLARAANS